MIRCKRDRIISDTHGLRCSGIRALISVIGFVILALIATTPTVWGANKVDKPFNVADWGERYFPTKPVRGGMYRIATSVYVGMMNPNHWPVNDFKPINFMYDRLLYIDGKYKPFMPFLLESWEYADPRTLVFKLRKGIRFSDGSEFNADGLKYQFEWILDKKNGAWTRSWILPIKSVTVIDDHTLRIHTDKPWGGAIGVLNSVPGMAISAKALQGEKALAEVKKLTKRLKTARKKAQKAQQKAQSKGTDKLLKSARKAQKSVQKLEKQIAQAEKASKGARLLDSHPVGSGPYRLDTGSPGNYLKLKRNPNWWFGERIGHPEMPYFDSIKFVIIPDANIQLANIKAGKIDRLEMGKALYRLVKNDRQLNVYVNPAPHLDFMLFNHAKGPCQDIRVRKAISHAIDRKALIVGTQFGLTQIATGIYPADHWCHNPDLQPVKYDPELSKKLLAEAGFADGLTLNGTVSNNQAAMTVAVAVKSMLSKVGIDWQIVALDSAASSDKLKNRDYDTLLTRWRWIFEPDLMPSGAYLPEGGFNYGRSNNARAIALIEAGRREVDPQKRQKIYYQLEEALYENYEDAWLWYGLEIMAFRKNVMGWNNRMYIDYRESFRWTHPLWFKDGKP